MVREWSAGRGSRHLSPRLATRSKKIGNRKSKRLPFVRLMLEQGDHLTTPAAWQKSNKMKTLTTEPDSGSPAIVSRDKWLAARKKLLEKEKELTRLRDRLNAERRELPWLRVEKNYLFDGPDGKETLADLFEGHSQLGLKEA